MASNDRMLELFAANDWTAIYRAFSEINLNSYDFSTIRAAMVEYIRINYSEDFNDWIESSEFVAIIDLLSYLGQSLAFRTDINARENFIDIARRRESIIRLAQSLSYPVKRNYPARGLVKLTEIRTNQDVYDANGRNLNNVTIRWDDPTNNNWFEQWIIVLNASLVDTNPFGTPLKTGMIDNISTQLYRVDNIPITNGAYSFNANVNNDRYSFDAVNADFNTTFGFVEQSPNPNASYHIIYRSDGNGNSSEDTGFFLYFKQGNLQYSDYVISEPVENRIIDINVNNINENDVWVQSVDELGAILNNGDWTKVGHVPSDDIVKILLTSDNIQYNDIDPDIQNIYQVITRENDQISLQFGDGRFGVSPSGNLRTWYRTSTTNGLTIRPNDMQGISIIIPYYAGNNNEKRITFTFALQYTVNNSVTAETNDEIRRRASRVYSTQGRMVSGSDYNELPVQTNLAVKMKAINRIYSGQSRYIDLNDPTGTYKNLNIFADDGAMYVVHQLNTFEINTSDATVDELMHNYIQDSINSEGLQLFFSNYLYSKLPDNDTDIINNLTNNYLQNTNVERAVYESLMTNSTFALGFDNDANTWYVIPSSDLDVENIEAPYEFISSDNPGPNSWLVFIEYSTTSWRIISRNDVFTFESRQDCKFYFTNETKSIDPTTGKAGIDTIRVLKKANALNRVQMLVDGELIYPFQSDLVLQMVEMFTETDGFQDPTKTIVKLPDVDSDGYIDMPYAFKALENIDPDFKFIVHKTSKDSFGYESSRLIQRLQTDVNGNIVTQLAATDYGFVESSLGIMIYKGSTITSVPTSADVCLNIYNNDPAILTEGSTDVRDPNSLITNTFLVQPGVDDLNFQWIHFAPSQHRIDPSISNIIDMFVLTKEYHEQMITWRNSGSAKVNLPSPPSTLSLQTDFGGLEQYKMYSDEMIWKPTKFKLLFGEVADKELRATFKVVRLLGTTMSDGEIRSQVIENMRTFFDVSNWEFGETFYFTELASYIHRQLAGAIASIEIVPVLENSNFGNLREIRCEPDELFFCTAQVSDVEIIASNTPSNLRMK